MRWLVHQRKHVTTTGKPAQRMNLCRIMTTAQRWWERRFEQFIITNRNIPLHSKWKIQKQSVQHFLPACLQAFLVSNDLKRVGKGLTITQAVSKWCFSISYDEVYLFEHSVLHKESLLLITVNSAQTILIPTTINESSTFHGVGIIRWSRSKLNFQKTETRIRRRARIMISDLVDPKQGSSLSTFWSEPIRKNAV